MPRKETEKKTKPAKNRQTTPKPATRKAPETEVKPVVAEVKPLEQTLEDRDMGDVKNLPVVPVAPQPSMMQSTRFIPSSEQIEVLRRTYANTLTDLEFETFLMIAKASGLNPFLREITVMKAGEEDNPNNKVMVPITTIEGYRKLTRDIQLEHWKFEWCGNDGIWKDIWLSKEHPAAARFCGKVKGQEEYTNFPALWDNYARYKRNGELFSTWKKMGSLLLAKCAEAGWRRMMKGETFGIYTVDEMGQALNEKPELPSTFTREKADIPEPKTEAGRQSLLNHYIDKYPLDKNTDHAEDLKFIFAKLKDWDYSKEEAYEFIRQYDKLPDVSTIHFSEMSKDELQRALAIVACFDELRGADYKKKRANEQVKAAQAPSQPVDTHAEPPTRLFSTWDVDPDNAEISQGVYNLLKPRLLDLITHANGFSGGNEDREAMEKLIAQGEDASYARSAILADLIKYIFQRMSRIDDTLMNDLRTCKIIKRR